MLLKLRTTMSGSKSESNVLSYETTYLHTKKNLRDIPRIIKRNFNFVFWIKLN